MFMRRTASSIRQDWGRSRPPTRGGAVLPGQKVRKLRKTASAERGGGVLQYVELPRDVVVVYVADPHLYDVVPPASRRVFGKTKRFSEAPRALQGKPPCVGVQHVCRGIPHPDAVVGLDADAEE